MKPLGRFLLLLALLAGRLAAADEPPLAALRAADDERIAAMLAADPVRLAAILSDQPPSAHPSGLLDPNAPVLHPPRGSLGRAVCLGLLEPPPRRLDLVARLVDLRLPLARELLELGVAALVHPVTDPREERFAGLAEARLTFRAGVQDLRIRTGRDTPDLYRGRFDGATPQVRVRDGRVLVQYRGIPFDWRTRTATIALNPAIPWPAAIRWCVAAPATSMPW